MTVPDPTTPDSPRREPRHEEIIHEESTGRLGVVRAINGAISLVTGLFAVVLAIHILLVLGGANMGHPFAQFISGWAGAVDLGLANLFTLPNDSAQIALNQGLAAILWLIIGALLTTLIARIMLPDPADRVWYRRRVVR